MENQSWLENKQNFTSNFYKMSVKDIPRLIDLALVTPETGNLNLKILHTVLHAIASQLMSFEALYRKELSSTSLVSEATGSEEPDDEQILNEGNEESTKIRETVFKENLNETNLTKENLTKENLTKENVEQNLTKETKTKDKSAKYNSTKDTSTKDNSPKDNSTKDALTKDALTKDASTKYNSTKENSTKDTPTKYNSKKDTPTKDNSTKDNSTKDNLTKDNSTKGISTKKSTNKENSSKENLKSVDSTDHSLIVENTLSDISLEESKSNTEEENVEEKFVQKKILCCLSKKVDRLHQTFSNLENSFDGINFQKLKENFGKNQETLDEKTIKNEKKTIFLLKENEEMKKNFGKLDRHLKIVENLVFDKIVETKIRFEELDQTICQNKDEAFNELSKVENLVCRNQKELCEIWDEVDCCVKFNKESKLNFENIFETLKKIKIDFEKSSKETEKLFEKSELCRKEVKYFNDKLELFSCRKANLDEMNEQFSLKADKTDMEKRAFMKRCEKNHQENSVEICGILDQIDQLEKNVKSELIDFKSIIDEKASKNEIENKSKFLENRLKSVNEAFGKIIHFKNNAEASIATSEYQKDLCCISCCDSVMMKRQEIKPAIPKMGLLIKSAKSVEDFRMIDTDRIKTRFSGGKHTILDPKEKLMRVGDFRNQNLVFHYPTADLKYVEGNDGVLYRADSSKHAKICKTCK